MKIAQILRALAGVPPLVRIAVLDLHPGDVILVEVDQPLSMNGRRALSENIKQIWPNNKVVVLDGSMRVRAVRNVPPEGGDNPGRRVRS